MNDIPTKTPTEIIEMFEHIVRINNTDNGLPRISLCVWGMHGIGKTAMFEQYAKEKDWGFAYLALAEGEEIGDLIGKPEIKDGYTINIPPDFTEPFMSSNRKKEGIFLIDDFNRADYRVLNGIMQLLIRYKFKGWEIPDRWHIVLTANPEDADYSVNTIDDAYKTRMCNVGMVFDYHTWKNWALNNGIKSHMVNFVGQIEGEVKSKSAKLTTPRSLVNFFKTIEGINSTSLIKTFALSNSLTRV